MEKGKKKKSRNGTVSRSISRSIGRKRKGKGHNSHHSADHRNICYRGVFQEECFELSGGHLVPLDFDQLLQPS